MTALIDRLDATRARIAAQPWRSVGRAFAVGAWLALDTLRLPRGRLARAALAVIGSLVVRATREVALREFVAVMAADGAGSRARFGV